jgi:hypothetical protein
MARPGEETLNTISRRFITPKVAAEPEWNVEAICKRQAELAKLALKAWPI